MKLATKLVGTLGSGALLLASAITPAGAATITNTYPETPLTNPTLPVVHVAHGSDTLKANILNPRPVCNAWEDKRTAIYKVTDSFLPVGTISTTNQTASPIPLTQTLSKTQTISIKVNGSQTETTSVNGGGSGTQGGGTGTAGIAYSLAKTIGGEASYSLSWQVGQTVGPYQVPAGYTGEATYGFRTITMTGTQQYCKLDGTWSTPAAYVAFVPIKNEVRVKLYNNPADSAK